MKTPLPAQCPKKYPDDFAVIGHTTTVVTGESGSDGAGVTYSRTMTMRLPRIDQAPMIFGNNGMFFGDIHGQST